MRPTIHQIADDFWNIRGSFKVFGAIEIGTQASLVRRNDGKFVLLDSITLPSDVKRTVDALTNGGKDIQAILNVHPFHTVYVALLHETYPHAKLYGTARHVSLAPQLPWEKVCVEDRELHEWFSEDFQFSIPSGVDFVSSNKNVHFSSVMVFHRASKTIHVDDTLMYIQFPSVLRTFAGRDRFFFHPTLNKALQRRAGAADAFRSWAMQVAEQWHDAQNLCAAHAATLIARSNAGESIRRRIIDALDKVEGRLLSHANKYG